MSWQTDDIGKKLLKNFMEQSIDVNLLEKYLTVYELETLVEGGGSCV